MIFIGRFIIGTVFFLVLLFGITLLFIKDDFVRSPKMHRYLGASVLLTACSLLYMYIEMVCPGNITLSVVKIIIALVTVCIYAFIGYKIILHLNKKYTIVPVKANKTPSKEETFVKANAVDFPDEEDIDEEIIEDDDNDDTDEDGDLIPEPSVNNMDDLIFFQKLESLMARKKLFKEQGITREEIASEIGTNRTYLIRSIKLATGMTFNEYITSLRVNYAATLLITTNEPLEFIGTIAGFRSKSAYYKAFMTANNCTPQEYRALNK